MRTIFIISLILFLLILFAYQYQERLIFFPEKLPKDFLFQFPFPHEEVFLQTDDNSEIHGLYFAAKNPKGVILYFHGNAGSLRTWGFVAGDFLSLGYSVFIVDYRGYGKSESGLSEKNLLNDSKIAYSYLQKKYSEDKIIVYGRSIGTGIAVHLASQTKPKLLILESPFFNLAELAKYHYPFIPSFFLKYKFASNEKVTNVQCKIFIFHGERDSIIPIYFGEKLAKIHPKQTQFVSIKYANHNNLNEFTEYWKKIQDITRK